MNKPLLFINTTLKGEHTTTLTKKQVLELKNRVDDFDYDLDINEQFDEIKDILDILKTAGLKKDGPDDMNLHMMFSTYEKVAVEKKRGSKPPEFLSLIDGILNNILPFAKANGGKRKNKIRKTRRLRK